jgi:hypothetical protein
LPTDGLLLPLTGLFWALERLAMIHGDEMEVEHQVRRQRPRPIVPN